MSGARGRGVEPRRVRRHSGQHRGLWICRLGRTAEQAVRVLDRAHRSADSLLLQLGCELDDAVLGHDALYLPAQARRNRRFNSLVGVDRHRQRRAALLLRTWVWVAVPSRAGAAAATAIRARARGPADAAGRPADGAAGAADYAPTTRVCTATGAARVRPATTTATSEGEQDQQE